MNETIPVNFHCHSIFSDGDLTPEVLAENLASAGVKFASLTDHDSLEGLPRFQEALKKRGIAFLPGVELTTQFEGKEAHILGYGFDPKNAELVSTLVSIRQIQHVEFHSIAGSMRKVGVNRINHPSETLAPSSAPHGLLDVGEAIALIHRAGGCAFWAHPLCFESNLVDLEIMIANLKLKGLDGIECVYSSFSETDQELLRVLAIKYDLLISAGTDFHGNNGLGSKSLGIEMRHSDWIKFREAIFDNLSHAQGQSQNDKPDSSEPYIHGNLKIKAHHFHRRSYVLRIFLPTFIAIALFLAAIWVFILPSIKNTLIDRKREMIRELTNSALSILISYEHDERTGLVNREEAQSLAISRIEALRYGPEGKDYFWIQDLEPKMIMHPYRPDLNGQDLSDFMDPRGVNIFVEFASLVQRSGEGYIDYVWQWKDDPTRLEPKESYVKGFSPWGWVIGTGIYIDDVNLEIERIEQSLINTSLGISGAIILLLIFVLQQSLKIEKERQEVVDDLRESTNRYHALVEATTEGTLLVLDDRCRYANPVFLDLLGYSENQLEFLELTDLLPKVKENSAVWDSLQNLIGVPPKVGEAFEGYLKRNDGSLIECILTINPIFYAEQRGFILLAKNITRQSDSLNDDGLAAAAQSLPVGIFRARANRRGVFLEINRAGLSMLNPSNTAEKSQPALADLFSDLDDFQQFIQTIHSKGEVIHHLLHLETIDASVRYISLTASLIRDENQQPEFITGFLQDVTDARKLTSEREFFIDRLQASFLFLHEPLTKLGHDVVICSMDDSIQQVSRIMTVRKVTAALVVSENKTVIGIVTDHDLRARVLAENVDIHSPIHTIMSAPVAKISENSPVYQALVYMEEKGVRHLAVEDQSGKIVNIIDNKSLIQFQSYAPIVLAREILRAKSPEDVQQNCIRTTPLVKTLFESSANPHYVTNILANICDSATIRLIQLAFEKIGPPPALFAFIAMGSHGRQEQTLLTDQDNGIIFAPVPGSDMDTTSDYFIQLGKVVCDGLNKAGYPYCRGGIMANNPRWCRSLPDWITDFNAWVRKSEPQEVMDFSISLDFRTVFGEIDLLQQLRQHIHSTLKNEPAFYNQLALNALEFKPPFRLLGNIYIGGGNTEQPGEINLKDALMPIVCFARLYALKHQIHQTHTLERIKALAERNIIQDSSKDEISTAYDFLMRLRLQNQLMNLESGQPVSNSIHPSKLGHIQEESLKRAFSQIAAIQKKISYDFLGGT